MARLSLLLRQRSAPPTLVPRLLRRRSPRRHGSACRCGVVNAPPRHRPFRGCFVAGSPRRHGSACRCGVVNAPPLHRSFRGCFVADRPGAEGPPVVAASSTLGPVNDPSAVASSPIALAPRVRRSLPLRQRSAPPTTLPWLLVADCPGAAGPPVVAASSTLRPANDPSAVASSPVVLVPRVRLPLPRSQRSPPQSTLPRLLRRRSPGAEGPPAVAAWSTLRPAIAPSTFASSPISRRRGSACRCRVVNAH